MMKNTLKVVLLTSMLPLAASASQELTPWYVGAGLGVNNYEHIATDNGDDNPYAWDIFAAICLMTTLVQKSATVI